MIMCENEIHSATSSLHFNVHHSSDTFNKLVEIGEQKVSAHRLLRCVWNLQNLETRSRDEITEIIE